MDANGRECVSCGLRKPWSDFNRNARSSTGYDNRCRACMKLYRQTPAYKKAHRAKARLSYSDPVKRAAQLQRMRAYRQLPSVQARMRSPDYLHERAAYSRAYVSDPANAPRCRKLALRRMKRYLSNPTVRLSLRFGEALRLSLHGRTLRRNWFSLVGYSLSDLKAHLEALFLPGMSWDNLSKTGWRIAHLNPVSSYTFQSYSDPAFRECWALSNLIPRWIRPPQLPCHLSKKEGFSIPPPPASPTA